MVDRKKRRIAKKPAEATAPPAADDWVSEGGLDPEINIQTSKQLDSQTSKQTDVQTPKQVDVQTPKRLAKSKDTDNYKKTTLYLPIPFHKRFKNAANNADLEMSTVAELAIAEWLKKNT